MELVGTDFYNKDKRIAVSAEHSTLVAQSKVAWTIQADITNLTNDDVIDMILKSRQTSSIFAGTKIFAMFTENLCLAKIKANRADLEKILKDDYFVDMLMSASDLDPKSICPQYHKERMQRICDPVYFLGAEFHKKIEPDFNKRSVVYYVNTYIDGSRVLREPHMFFRPMLSPESVAFHMDIHWLTCELFRLIFSWILWLSPYRFMYGVVQSYCKPKVIFENMTNSKLMPTLIDAGRCGVAGDIGVAVNSLPFMSSWVGRVGIFFLSLIYWTFNILTLSSAGSIVGMVTYIWIFMHSIIIYWFISHKYTPGLPYWHAITQISGGAKTIGQKLSVLVGRSVGCFVYAAAVMLLMPAYTFQWIYLTSKVTTLALLEREQATEFWTGAK